jgi:DNA-binding transcriptional LysR family regulator
MMKQHGIQPQRIVEFGSNEGIVRAVAAGLGVGMAPTRTARELYMLKEIMPVNYPHKGVFLRPLFQLTLRDRPLSPLAKAFVNMLSPLK